MRNAEQANRYQRHGQDSFFNQLGILVKKNLIEKDMLFGLIGVGLTLDQDALKFVLKAHADSHDIKDMHNDFHTICNEHAKWRKKK